ncbi:MAG: DUF3261 domain-containing protein [Planctomycetes bacterium]|nr:DUF3261 domain-containing protein [Planctomycetota bacterium]
MPRRPLLAACLLAAACAAPPRQPFADRDYPGTLLPAAALDADVLWQQRVTATWGEDGRRGFDAAVQKQGEALTVLGLSPVGAIGFVIVLRGTEVELQNPSGEDLPFPPRFVLLDVQRTFYPWLGRAPAHDGERDGTVGDERVHESWQGGRLRQRRFERLDGVPQGAITIRYEWPDDAQPTLAPPRTVLDNGWFGYRLAVDTHTEMRLPPPTP